MQASNEAGEFFAALASTNAGRRKYQEKKDELFPAIGKKIKSKKRKYILLLFLSLIVFVS